MQKLIIMIKKTLLRSIILLSLTLLLVNCSKDDDVDTAHSLVGSWRYIDLETDYKYTETIKFNSNKNGSVVWIEDYNGEIDTAKIDFTWSTDVDVLTVIFDDDEMDAVNIYYSIEGNKLSINEGEGYYTVYTKI